MDAGVKHLYEGHSQVSGVRCPVSTPCPGKRWGVTLFWLNGLKKVPFEEILRLMDSPTLSYWRLRGDAIETYKFVHGKYSVDWSSLLPLADETATVVTRFHTFKLKKRDCKTSVRLNFFSYYRIVNFWNSLPESVVSAPSVNCFKHRLDEHYIDLMFDTTLWTCSFKISQQSCGLIDWRSRWWWYAMMNSYSTVNKATLFCEIC